MPCALNVARNRLLLDLERGEPLWPGDWAELGKLLVRACGIVDALGIASVGWYSSA